jgi:hypothetical protein
LHDEKFSGKYFRPKLIYGGPLTAINRRVRADALRLPLNLAGHCLSIKRPTDLMAVVALVTFGVHW